MELRRLEGLREIERERTRQTEIESQRQLSQHEFSLAEQQKLTERAQEEANKAAVEERMRQAAFDQASQEKQREREEKQRAEFRNQIFDAVGAKIDAMATMSEARLVAEIFRTSLQDSPQAACSAGPILLRKHQDTTFFHFATELLRAPSSVDPFTYLSSYQGGFAAQGYSNSFWPEPYPLSTRLEKYVENKRMDGVSVAGIVPLSRYALAIPTLIVTSLVHVPGLSRVLLGPHIKISRTRLAEDLKKFTDSNPGALDARLDAQEYLLQDIAQQGYCQAGRPAGVGLPADHSDQ